MKMVEVPVVTYVTEKDIVEKIVEKVVPLVRVETKIEVVK